LRPTTGDPPCAAMASPSRPEGSGPLKGALERLKERHDAAFAELGEEVARLESPDGRGSAGVLRRKLDMMREQLATDIDAAGLQISRENRVRDLLSSSQGSKPLGNGDTVNSVGRFTNSATSASSSPREHEFASALVEREELARIPGSRMAARSQTPPGSRTPSRVRPRSAMRNIATTSRRRDLYWKKEKLRAGPSEILNGGESTHASPGGWLDDSFLFADTCSEEGEEEIPSFGNIQAMDIRQILQELHDELRWVDENAIRARVESEKRLTRLVEGLASRIASLEMDRKQFQVKFQRAQAMISPDLERRLHALELLADDISQEMPNLIESQSEMAEIGRAIEKGNNEMHNPETLERIVVKKAAELENKAAESLRKSMHSVDVGRKIDNTRLENKLRDALARVDLLEQRVTEDHTQTVKMLEGLLADRGGKHSNSKGR